MDNKRKLLKTYQNNIVQDLDPTYIIDHLYTNNVITNDEFERIFNCKDRADRTRYLLSLVQNGNIRLFDVFVDSLAKDYDWLYEKLNTTNMNSTLNESFEDCLSRGDVPRLPEYYVQRTALEQEVASKLSALSRHKVLVLHGMSGCGKSSVLIGTLRHNPAIVTDDCGGMLFWLNLGNVKTDDDIICQQIKLYRKTSQFRRRGSTYMASSISMSSIGSNSDSQSFTSGDWCWQDLRDRLKAIFQDEDFKKALLILDEVNDKRFVEAFDIGCKILITTRDTEVVANLQPQIIKVQNHFEEDESLRLFATCLDVSVSKLPTSKAKKLHASCKGCPFHIALIGAQLAENRERLLHDNKRWDYYIDQLKKRDILYLFQRGTEINPMKPIEICVNSLEPSTLQMFKKLAVLPDNVKITDKVLAVLWNRDIRKVEAILKQLKGKSLIYQTYEHEQKNYSYEIHDIITNYLKHILSQEEISKIHVEFLKNYGYVNVDKLPIELPDDGYIPYYIGYHIENTHIPEKSLIFNKLFLNLKFLGNKVRLTGPADVIMDFQKYGHNISGDKIDDELIRNITEFLSKHGNDLYRFPNTDIVQSILQYESRGLLFQKAHHVAHEACANRHLYFEFQHEDNVNEMEKMKHSIDIDVKQNISSVCFLYDYIIVGTDKGTIKIFHIYTNKLKKELNQCTARVLSLNTCRINVLQLGALDSLGILHLWYLDELEPVDDDAEITSSENDENEYDISFTDGYTSISPIMGRFLSFSWANNSRILVTHTSKMMAIYTPDGLPIHVLDIYDRDVNIICCLFSYDDNTIITGYELKGFYYIDVIKWESNKVLMTFKEETDRILNILCLPVFSGNTNSILVINSTEVRRYEWKSNDKHKNTYNKSEKILSNKEIKDNVQFITSVVNKAGSLLFVSTNDSRIICVDLNRNSYFDLDNIRGDVITMAVSIVEAEELTPGCDVLATGTGHVEHSVKLWYCDMSYVNRAIHPDRKVRLTAKFDVSFVHATTPKPCDSPSSDKQLSNSTTPKRHQSFVNIKEEKKLAKKTLSLDRHALKPLNLKGISNGNEDCGGIHPLLAVVDDRNNIQIMRGRKTLAEVTIGSDDEITTIRISPCNQYVVYGLQSGTVKQYTIKTKELKTLMDVYSKIQYLNYVNPNLLIAFSKNRCMMAYRFNFDGACKLEMLQKGEGYLGSQEILNDIKGKKTSQSGSLSSSGSETSMSRERLFPCSDGKGRLGRGSSLVQCFWVQNIGMLSIEDSATIKLWDENLNLITVLNGRQTSVCINCAAFQRNVLVICDDYGKFQTFKLRNDSDSTSLHTIQEYNLNNKIMSCDLTQDGHILAMGLDSGAVVVWNVTAKTQLTLLKHHKSQCPVQACLFSPLPERLYRSAANSPTVNHSFNFANNNEQDYEVPLVLVTMASEILWWDISYLMKIRSTKRAFWNRGRNFLSSPLTSPIEPKTELTGGLENLNLNNHNQFFGNGYNKTDSWEKLWKRKTYKEGSKRKEILACVKLSGINAKKLCVDENFSCFVTIDNPGHIHIMNVMKPNCS